MPLGSCVVVFPVASLEPALVPEFGAEGFIGLPGFMEVPGFVEPGLPLPALIPGLLGTSEPEEPGTELPTEPELPALPDPMLPLPAEPEPPAPAAAPPAPPPAPPDSCAKAFALNVAIASERVAPSKIVGKFFFIVTTP